MDISKNFLNTWVARATLYRKHVALGFAFLASFMVMGGVYRLYQKNSEAKAHKAFVESFKVYSAPITAGSAQKSYAGKTFSTKADKWQAVVDVYQAAYQAHKGSGLAPFFLAFCAEGYYNLGKIDQAISTLHTAIGSMKNAQLKATYQVKLALYKLDSTQESVVQEGLKDLTDFAGQESLPVHDFVLYQLGEYYWIMRQFDKVKNYWKMLTLKYGASAATPSPWARLVDERLALLESK